MNKCDFCQKPCGFDWCVTKEEEVEDKEVSREFIDETGAYLVTYEDGSEMVETHEGEVHDARNYFMMLARYLD